ncbi:MAG: sulfatase [Candidatus Hydrogenedentes bacterium]|nr:sulfatase [Candidatus Hydrogenedentota bacterium]
MAHRGIRRRDFMKQCGAGLLSVGAGSCVRGQAGGSAVERPNIVFILVDDLGWADVGCYGNRFNEAPHIDRLAADGMRFTDAYAAAPVCSPTRVSIMSGQYPARVGVTDFIPGHQRPWAKLTVPRNRQQYLPLEIETVAERLKTAGYACAMLGKWHLGGREYFPDRQGFDEMLVSNGRHFGFGTMPKTDIPEDAYLAEFLTERAEGFMEAHRNEPFFLYLSHFAVHIPLDARKALIEKYENKPKPPGGINNPVYAAMVEHVDNSVGRIVAKLDELGLQERTLVCFMSDNGGLRCRFDGDGPLVTSNAPLRDEKGTLYEGGIREPLIFRWPGQIKAGVTCATPVSSVDFYPTFLDAAGAAAPANQPLDGVSVMPLLRRRGAFERDALFWHYPHYHHSTPASAVREGDWKLIEFFEDGHVELYNVRDDIGETRDWSGDKPQIAARLQRMLAEWRERVSADMPEPNPDYDLARAGEWLQRG